MTERDALTTIARVFGGCLIVKEVPEAFTITNPEIFDELRCTPWERRRAIMMAAKKR